MYISLKIKGKEPWKAKFNNRDKTILPSLSGLEKGNLMNLCTNRHNFFFLFLYTYNNNMSPLSPLIFCYRWSRTCITQYTVQTRFIHVVVRSENWFVYSPHLCCIFIIWHISKKLAHSIFNIICKY